MKVKFNKFERVAGVFVLSVILSGVFLLAGVAIKQGWFESKIKYATTLKNADGIRVGTSVQMAGLRAGQVVQVELRSGNEVHITFEISEKYQGLIRQDSVARTVRPFIISEKVLEVSIGDQKLPIASNKVELPSEATADVMDLVSGRTLGPHLQTMGKMMENLRVVAEAILDPNRTQEIIRIFDELSPLVKNMNSMAGEVSGLLKAANKNKQLVHVVDNLYVTTKEVNKLLPELNKVVPEVAKLAPIIGQQSPQLAKDLGAIATNMAILTNEITETLPAVKATLKEIGPDVPFAARRAIEALDETVVTLRALQKSFILRSNAQEVRQEEADRAKKRVPASKKEEEKVTP